MACADGWLPVLFDAASEGVLRLGRSQRLFSARQRTALVATWGGCGIAQCDRPPSWCEAHHLDEWQQDHGAPDVEDGILLCRHHHMLIHNLGLRIRHRHDGDDEVVHRNGAATDLRIRGKNPVRERRRERARRARGQDAGVPATWTR